MARSLAAAAAAASNTYNKGSSSDSGSTSSGSDCRRHHRSSRRKEGASSSALKVRKGQRSRNKGLRWEREWRLSPFDNNSYSSTSSYDSDHEVSGRSWKHKKSRRSRKASNVFA